MKLAAASAIAFTALLSAVKADFDVYAAGIGGNGISGNAWGFQVYDGDANCDNNLDWIWRKSDDVSGGKYGVRCKGDGCAASEDPAGIKEMEFNFNSDELHFTLYADRGWGLFDLEGNNVGACEPASEPIPVFFCGAGLGRAEGQKKVHCTTGAATGAKITDNRPK